MELKSQFSLVLFVTIRKEKGEKTGCVVVVKGMRNLRTSISVTAGLSAF